MKNVTDGKVVDISIYDNGSQATVIAITKFHIVESYIVWVEDDTFCFMFDIMTCDNFSRCMNRKLVK